MEIEIARGDAADVETLRDLWLQMLSHHRSLIAGDVPVRTAEESWRHARREHREWLENETATLFLARTAGSPGPVGYALCRLLASGPTFGLGAVRGEVDSLVIEAQARGQGVGTALLEAVRADLVSRGIAFWSIGVLAHNDAAVRLYERLGFRPWTQQLLGHTHL